VIDFCNPPLNQLDASLPCRRQSQQSILQLAYRSKAISDLGHLHLFHLLAESERANKKSDITGHLQYKNQVFMQYIEGPCAAVQRLWERIQLDSRHRSLELLCLRCSKRRRLIDWSMSFTASPTYANLGIPGFIPLDNRDVSENVLRACIN